MCLMLEINMAWDSNNPWSHDVYGKESKMNKKHTHKKKPVLKVYKEPYGEKKNHMRS